MPLIVQHGRDFVTSFVRWVKNSTRVLGFFVNTSEKSFFTAFQRLSFLLARGESHLVVSQAGQGLRESQADPAQTFL